MRASAIITSIASCCFAACAAAQETLTTDAHPHLSASGRWVPVMLIIAGGLFLAAAVIGPIVLANTPDEVPPMHSHDEPPGASHHHGKSGLENPPPEQM